MKDIKFVVARYANDGYDKFLGTSIGNYEREFIWNEEATGLHSKYNLGISRLKYDSDDIIIFCHADVKITDPLFDKKLKFAFDKVPTLGLIGVIGATELHETAGWWLSDYKYHRGHVVQWVDEIEDNKYDLTRQIGNFTNLVVVDGLFMATRGSVLNQIKFDSETFPTSYNFYDYDFSLMVKKDLNMLVGVLDISMEHKSVGDGIFKNDWIQNKEVFLSKWRNKGYKFPLR